MMNIKIFQVFSFFQNFEFYNLVPLTLYGDAVNMEELLKNNLSEPLQGLFSKEKLLHTKCDISMYLFKLSSNRKPTTDDGRQ